MKTFLMINLDRDHLFSKFFSQIKANLANRGNYLIILSLWLLKRTFPLNPIKHSQKGLFWNLLRNLLANSKNRLKPLLKPY